MKDDQIARLGKMKGWLAGKPIALKNHSGQKIYNIAFVHILQCNLRKVQYNLFDCNVVQCRASRSLCVCDEVTLHIFHPLESTSWDQAPYSQAPCALPSSIWEFREAIQTCFFYEILNSYFGKFCPYCKIYLSKLHNIVKYCQMYLSKL